jgi:hypothetical protein
LKQTVVEFRLKGAEKTRAASIKSWWSMLTPESYTGNPVLHTGKYLKENLENPDLVCHSDSQRRVLPLNSRRSKVSTMKTSHSKKRFLALCALIAEEKDPGKFLLLVQELNSAFENEERKVKNAPFATAHRTHRRGSVRTISPRA